VLVSGVAFRPSMDHGQGLDVPMDVLNLDYPYLQALQLSCVLFAVAAHGDNV